MCIYIIIKIIMLILTYTYIYIFMYLYGFPESWGYPQMEAPFSRVFFAIVFHSYVWLQGPYLEVSINGGSSKMDGLTLLFLMIIHIYIYIYGFLHSKYYYCWLLYHISPYYTGKSYTNMEDLEVPPWRRNLQMRKSMGILWDDFNFGDV